MDLSTFDNGFFKCEKCRIFDATFIDHLAESFDPKLHASDLDSYDTSGTRPRHILLIRALQKLKPYGPDARTCFLKARVAGKTKEDLADLIKELFERLKQDIEGLVKNCV